MTKTNKFVSAYVLLDYKVFTDEEREQLNQIMKSYALVFDELKTIGILKKRTLYYIALRDEKLINDQVDEENNITPGILTLFANRNPEILCAHNYNGYFLGHTITKTPAVYDEDDNLVKEEIITVEGEPTYALQKDKYISYMDDIVTYDDDGKELSRVKPTECKPIRMFGGFKEQRFE